MTDSSSLRPPGPEISESPDFLREPTLGRRLLGYSIADTDALLERAAATVGRLQKTIAALREQQAARTHADAAAAADPGDAGALPPAASALVGEVLITAHQAVELLKESAQHEARKVIDEAEGHATAILTEDARERSLREQERRETQQLLEDARSEAARIIELAKRDREDVVAETERLRTAADDLRRRWLEQISHLLAQLSNPLMTDVRPDTVDIQHELIARVQDPGSAGDSPRE